MLTYGSVCSGIESASVAWEPLGMKPLWFSEIEAFPSAVLAHRWPGVVNLGDMTRLATAVQLGVIPAPDILVGGTPCQAFSVAGKRGGLGDERGQLTLEHVRLLNAIDEQRQTPATCVWENVPGVLSSRDNAFGCFLGALAGEDRALQPSGKKWTNAGCVYGPQRAVAWRILDAQYFGVAQRRRRVFVVASARNGPDPTKILFEREGVRRDTPPVRETPPEIARTITARAQLSHREDGDTLVMAHGQGGAEINSELSPTLSCNHEAPIAFAQNSRDEVRESGIPGSLSTGGGKPGQGYPAVRVGDAVRRLVPVECERLQGFPDNHTQILWRGKAPEGCPDGPRYKAIGNSKAVPVVRWIGQRIINETGTWN